MSNPIIDKNGHQRWYKDGKYHREDGPAVILTSGTEFWYKDGRRHREDGPASIFGDGDQYWYKNDVRYTFEGYCKAMNFSNEKILELKLRYL